MKLKITVEGHTYDVDVEVVGGEAPAAAAPASAPAPVSAPAPRPAAEPEAKPAAVPTPSSASTGPVSPDKVCKSPLAGTILRVMVDPGTTVAMNQVIFIIEAMKMESNIASPVAGTIKNIRVSAGEAVKQGQILAEYE